MRIRPNKDMSSCVLSSELQGMFGFAVLHILTKETKAPWRFRADATVLCNTQQQFFLFFTSLHEQTILDLLPFIVVAFLLMPALQMRHSYYDGMHTCVQHCVLYVTLWIDFMINDIFVFVLFSIGCTSGREVLRRPSVNVKEPWSCFRKELSQSDLLCLQKHGGYWTGTGTSG